METEPINPFHKPGTLYIMHEIDYLDGSTFDYYKIGIVRGEREAADREKDHRTGNPRQIVTKYELASNQVQRLETMLHNQFAIHRVSSGEWFHLPGYLVEQVHERAKELAIYLDSVVELLSDAKIAREQERTNEVVISDDQLKSVASELAQKNAELDVYDKYVKAIAAQCKTLLKSDPELARLFKYSDRKETNNFSATEFKKKYKELYNQFVRPKTKWVNEYLISIENLDGILKEVETNLGFTLQDVPNMDGEDLHLKYLTIWGRTDLLKTERDILEARLDIACGNAIALEGILIWQQKTSQELDKEALKEAHPTEYEDSFVYKPASTVTSLAEWKSY